MCIVFFFVVYIMEFYMFKEWLNDEYFATSLDWLVITLILRLMQGYKVH